MKDEEFVALAKRYEDQLVQHFNKEFGNRQELNEREHWLIKRMAEVRAAVDMIVVRVKQVPNVRSN